jgi:hypothetical protein
MWSAEGLAAIKCSFPQRINHSGMGEGNMLESHPADYRLYDL